MTCNNSPCNSAAILGVVQEIRDALAIAAREMGYSEPVVRGHKVDWDGGPSEWTINLTGGQSMWSAEIGQWVKPMECEKPVQAVLERHRDSWIVECENSWSLGVYDA